MGPRMPKPAPSVRFKFIFVECLLLFCKHFVLCLFSQGVFTLLLSVYHNLYRIHHCFVFVKFRTTQTRIKSAECHHPAPPMMNAFYSVTVSGLLALNHNRCSKWKKRSAFTGNSSERIITKETRSRII